ncbi:MAG: hypothetical protein IT162_06650 [Bryobacterales bacterium]|nr:hypothetical protein [Bryobacterales bacterium]
MAVTGLAAQEKPAGIRLTTWVREDIFAGFMAGDVARFERGMQKVAAALAADAGNAEALGWQGGGKLYRAVRAFEAGDRAAFDRHYAEARADFARGEAALASQPRAAIAYLATRGGSFTIMGDRFPPDLRKQAWTEVRTYYSRVREAQQEYFDKLPPHMRGEVLAGLTQAAYRLGEQDAYATALRELLTALPDSVYANRARKWQEQPETAARTSLVCQTCHDAARLDVEMKKVAEAKR